MEDQIVICVFFLDEILEIGLSAWSLKTMAAKTFFFLKDNTIPQFLLENILFPLHFCASGTHMENSWETGGKIQLGYMWK